MEIVHSTTKSFKSNNHARKKKEKGHGLKKEDIHRLGELFDRNQRFVITSHANPDGDAIGSEFALYHYLKSRGKSVEIINVDSVPNNLSFLEKNYKIRHYDKYSHRTIIEQADLICIVDISDWKRLQEIGEIIKEHQLPCICIDHHLVDEKFADEDFIYPEASSTGEIMFDLFTGLEFDFTPEVSSSILAAVMGDTGSFRFSNTSPKVFEIAAFLQKHGADRHSIYSKMFESETLPRIRLLARVLNNLRIEFGGKLAWMEVTQKMLREVGSTLKDTEGFSDFPRRINGVEVSLFFMELPEGRVKISFRSKGNVAVNELAKEFSGGGHAYAAGASVEGKLKDVREDILFRAQYLFE